MEKGRRLSRGPGASASRMPCATGLRATRGLSATAWSIPQRRPSGRTRQPGGLSRNRGSSSQKATSGGTNSCTVTLPMPGPGALRRPDQRSRRPSQREAVVRRKSECPGIRVRLRAWAACPPPCRRPFTRDRPAGASDSPSTQHTPGTTLNASSTPSHLILTRIVRG